MSNSESVVHDLAGSTAIVTGASRGFGRATAIALAAAGAHVVGVARSEAALGELHDQLGASFTPVVADVVEHGLAARLITTHHPRTLVLNAGTTPTPAALLDQTWETFNENWQVDVRHVFEFAHAALSAPLDAGAVVVSLSSGAALQGSPMSGGYAGAKSTIRFISSYAAAESERHELGIRFVALLPKLTPATGLGSEFVDAYAEYAGVDRDEYLRQFGATLSAEQVASSVVDLACGGSPGGAACLVTTDGMRVLA